MRAAPQKSGQLVSIAILAGLIAAFHMGKMPGALPHIGNTFHLTLPQAGLIVSSFSILAACLGLALGVLASRAGWYRAGIFGLVAAAVGSALGAISPTYGTLLASRLLEGFGFVLVAITMPGVINQVSRPEYRAIFMGIWGAFIPAAMSIMLFVSPWMLKQYQWQGMWWILAFTSLCWALVYAIKFRSLPLNSSRSARTLETIKKIGTGDANLVVGAFICYSAMFAAVTAFLPTYWVEQHQLHLGRASTMASIAVIGNIAGNILAGFLVQRGVSLRMLLIVALLAGGTFAAALFSGWLTISLEFLMAIGFTFFSGILPGAVFATLNAVVPEPEHTPLFVGMIFQGAGVGQVLGPVGLSTLVDRGGEWIFASLFIIAAAGLGALLGSKLDRKLIDEGAGRHG